MSATNPRGALRSAMLRLQPLPRGERFARVSLWTMYYFSALVIPVVERAVRTGRVPASAIDALLCERDADGLVVGFRQRADARDGHGFDDLVEDHLAVAVEICGRLTGFPARVAWSNAAVVIDYAIAEARGSDDLDANILREAEALIGAAGHPLLAKPFKEGVARERRVCCLRYLLPEGSLCAGICPKGSCGPRGALS